MGGQLGCGSGKLGCGGVIVFDGVRVGLRGGGQGVRLRGGGCVVEGGGGGVVRWRYGCRTAVPG